MRDLQTGTFKNIGVRTWAIYGALQLLALVLPLVIAGEWPPVVETLSPMLGPFVGLMLFPIWLYLCAGPLAAWQLSREQKDIRYAIDSESIRVSDGVGVTVIIPWTMVVAVRETSGGYAVKIRPRGVRWIPARTFDAQNAEAFRKLIREKGF
jgi:hypothetical protein